MSDRMDSKLRELTYRLIEMAPEAPPFPEESMVQLKPAPSPVAPVRRRSPLVWVGAAAAIVLLVVGLPLILFGPGDDTAPATSLPAPTVTAPPTTVPDVTPTSAPDVTAPPTTPPTAVDEPPSFFNVGVEEANYGFGYYPGRLVTTSPITVTGGSDADAEVTVNGEPAERFDPDGFRATVDLVPGDNMIEVVATRGGGAVEEMMVVRYVPDVTVELAYLTRVGTDEVVADYAQWLSGDEANQAAFEDGVIGSVEEGVPNGYYIRNVNDQLRTLTVAPDTVAVLVNPQDIMPVTVSVADWVALFKPDGSPWDYEVDTVPEFPAPLFDYSGASLVQTPYWVIVDADGALVEAMQQYIP